MILNSTHIQAKPPILVLLGDTTVYVESNQINLCMLSVLYASIFCARGISKFHLQITNHDSLGLRMGWYNAFMYEAPG